MSDSLVCGANLSVGYYHNHSISEIAYARILRNTIDRAHSMITEGSGIVRTFVNTPVKKYVYKGYTPLIGDDDEDAELYNTRDLNYYTFKNNKLVDSIKKTIGGNAKAEKKGAPWVKSEYGVFLPKEVDIEMKEVMERLSGIPETADVYNIVLQGLMEIVQLYTEITGKGEGKKLTTTEALTLANDHLDEAMIELEAYEQKRVNALTN